MSSVEPSDEGLATRELGAEEQLPGTIDALLEERVAHRYLVIEELGRGGMGRVLRAYDPKLQREVALKVVEANVFQPTARNRLLREARLMAQLSHPNVVAVYDVDVDPERGVIVAMELVRGATLREWLATRSPSPRQVLTAFVDAGRGLAAAHEAGLLHRDFKPANVLVSADGRVQVTDFGIAKARSDTPGEHLEREPPGPWEQPWEQVTDPGLVMGTPRYMAPEQHAGVPLTPAADQYAFCLALWEALTGAYPFGPPLRHNKLEGPPRWPSVLGVPRGVGEVLARGLAADAAARWPSMESLLAGLEAGLTRRRRNWSVLGAMIVLGLGVGAWQLWRESDDDRISHCRSLGDTIDEVWSDTARRRVHDGLLATGVAYAPDTAETVRTWLDRRAEDWRAARTESCLDAEVRGVWEPAVLDRAEWCLDDRRLELSTLVDTLSEADDAVVRRAVDATAELPPVGRCRDVAALAEQPEPPPPDERSQRERARAELFRARALLAAQRIAMGLEVLGPVIEQARTQGWPLLLAHA
ncbi:MAG: serine/threonine protein kinase, partial [Myxococcales bacterium]|nr:serine/threonine protein kinase [Myxococcales bacterium]